MSANSSSRIIRFSTFEVNLQTRELRQRGQKIKLQEQPFQLLVTLLDRPGEVVTREELAVAGGHLCRFRSRPQRRDQEVARCAWRIGGHAGFHRDACSTGLSLHRPIGTRRARKRNWRYPRHSRRQIVVLDPLGCRCIPLMSRDRRSCLGVVATTL